MRFTKRDSIVGEGVLVGNDPLGNIVHFDGPSSTLIKHVCCECQGHMRWSDGKGKYGTSHGYCGPCGQDMLDKIQQRVANAI